ncbi:hypothetical protein FACS189413_15860 [Bacteroidia bacterium]|nr:hypothetical protein FACS189413_15860 [Bacteroidia bacterium]
MNRILVLIGLVLSVSNGLYAQTYSEWIEYSFHYLDTNRLDSAEIALKNALRAEPDNPLNAFLFQNLGTVLRRQGKNKEAIEFYTLALRRYPQNRLILSDRASLNAETGDFMNALIDYNTLLEQDPNNEETLYQRGFVLLELKRTMESEQDFEKILKLNSASLSARLGLASLYKIAGRYDAAEFMYSYIEKKLLEKIKLSDGKEVEKKSFSEKEEEKELTFMKLSMAGRKEINLHSGFWDDTYLPLSTVYAGRAEIHLLKEKGGRALTEINKAIRESKTKNPYFYIIRSRAKLLLHEKQSAAEDIRKAIDLGYDVKDAEPLLQLTK